MIPPEIAAAVRAFATRPQALVGLDFDGVLAPIVEQRDEARPVAGAMDAVRRLAALPGLEVALVSGRALDSLAAVSGIADADRVSLIGSHGAEAHLHPDLRARPGGVAGAGAMTPEQATLLARAVAELQQIVDSAGPDSGLDVEIKPAGAVLHLRLAAPDVARAAEDRAMAGVASWPGIHPTQGKAVVELAVTESSKGAALQLLQALTGADAVLYAGDDVTDETAFAVLGEGDVSVKIGSGETRAAYRLDGPPDVAELLQLLLAVRSGRSQR